jgi:hypothetical protein
MRAAHGRRASTTAHCTDKTEVHNSSFLTLVHNKIHLTSYTLTMDVNNGRYAHAATLAEESPPLVAVELAPPEVEFEEDSRVYYDGTIPMNIPEEEIPMNLQEKVGGKCFGWCDYRRAAIFSTAAEAAFSVFWMVAFYADSKMMINEGGLDEEIMVLINKSNKLHATINAITIFSSFCAFAGALKYNVSFVTANISWMMFAFIFGLIFRVRTTANLNLYNPDYEYSTNWFAVVLTAAVDVLFVYAQAAFIQEVKLGVLSKETYPREAYSCCCLSQRKW